MTNINLYRNFNLSLADVYKAELERSIVVDVPRIASSEMSFAKKFIMTFSVAILAFAGIAVAVLVFLKPLAPEPLVPEVIYTPEIPPPLVAPMGDYVQIQVIEFTGAGRADTAPMAQAPVVDAPPTTPTRPQPVGAGSATVAQQPVVEAPVTPPVGAGSARPPVTQSAPAVARQQPGRANPAPTASQQQPAVPRYAIELEGATSAELALLRSIAGNTPLNYTQNTTTERVWTVYRHQTGTGIFVEGVEVVAAESFTNRDVAVAYAEQITGGGETTLIRPEGRTTESYNISICCTVLDNARQMAQRSGITDKIFQIREQ